MKIAYVSNSVVPSRAANSIQVAKNCEAFAKLGHDVTLLVPKRDIEDSSVEEIYQYYDVDPCFEIEKVPRPNLSSAGTFIVNCQIGRKASQMEPDLVYGRSTIACYVASRHGVPTIFESHAPMTQSRFGRVKNRFFSRMSQHSNFERLVVISEPLREYYSDQYPHLADDIVVAHNCAKPVGNIQAVDLKRSDDRLQVGYIGNLYEGRGMTVIAELARRVSDVDFHIVGGKPEDIARWREELTEIENITFHGFVPQNELDTYRLAFDVFLAPYQWDLETQAGYNTVQWMSPLKIVEYMAAGRAIVASDLPTLRETLTDQETALLCDPENASEWVRAVERLRDNTAFRERLGNQAQAEFEAKYTLEKRAKTVLGGDRPAKPVFQ